MNTITALSCHPNHPHTIWKLHTCMCESYRRLPSPNNSLLTRPRTCMNTSAHEPVLPPHTSPCHPQRHLLLLGKSSPPPPSPSLCQRLQAHPDASHTITTARSCQLCSPHRPHKHHTGLCPSIGAANLFCSGCFHNTSPYKRYLVHKRHCSRSPGTSTSGSSTQASAPHPG